MPEGPEIRRVADRLSEALSGERAERVSFGLDRLTPFEGILTGARVEAVTSRGKALLTRFDHGWTIYSHNQLYGRWYVCQPDRPPRTGRSLRLSIETDARWALLYSASEIEVLPDDEVDEHPFIAKLGPDLLDRGTTPALVRRRAREDRFRRRSLGALLLDQGFLAGVGNYLRSEILFFAGLRPDLRPEDLEDDELGRLSRAATSITRRAYRTGGVTEDSDLAARSRRAGRPRREWRHAVFGRAGQACRRCGTEIERFDVASRRLYVCPHCQP